MLVVDDSAQARMVLSRLLRNMGFEVVEVDGGSAALAEISQAEAAGHPYAVTFIDWLMPQMDGIAVADAMNVTDAGIFGDILCARMAKRGISALITDGVVRDIAGVLGTGLPVWCRGAAAPASVTSLTFVAWQQPIACGGVAVFPGDVIVVDQDGAVLIPANLLDEVIPLAVEQERLEAWIMSEVERGVPLPGLYPPNAEAKARYDADKHKF